MKNIGLEMSDTQKRKGLDWTNDHVSPTQKTPTEHVSENHTWKRTPQAFKRSACNDILRQREQSFPFAMCLVQIFRYSEGNLFC